MSDLAKKLFDSFKSVSNAVHAIAPGLKNLWTDMIAEAKRQGTQGSMELASALFNQNAFVPYGPGQYTPKSEHGHDQQQHQHELERER